MSLKRNDRLLSENFVLLECNYDDSHLNWELVKKEIIRVYSKNLCVYKERTDTKGLRCWTLWGQKKSE